ncbi:F-box protein At5g07610-like [Argentina anserina]|uniref:F-box protein At5g07610-like n=1 Tax=Argentina anserina TaxID=57926 RepID=UPI0021765959|nr:F-box protein At5g07610-like [Potentilla anserina]
MDQRFYLKRCTSRTSAETVANIEELLTEILLRVPARPLVRFKCVSKHWLSFISGPEFCHRHSLRNPKPSVSAVFSSSSMYFGFVPLDLNHDRNGNQYLFDSAGSPNFNPLNFLQPLHSTMIIQSCNGLVLCTPTNTSKDKFYLLNPTTNQFCTLSLPAAADSAQVFGYALAFDPSKSPHYKVVFLETINIPEGRDYSPYYHIHIYSSENRSWRHLNSNFVRLPNVSYKQGVYCNGAVHWVGLDDEVAYYHIDDECLRRVLPPPPDKEPSRKSRNFQASHCGSHLQLIDIYYVTSLIRFEVLEMGSDYSGWFLKYHLDFDPTLAPLPCLKSHRFTVLFLAPEEVEGEESLSMFLHYAGKVISYNFKSAIFKSFELPSRPGVDDSRLRVYYCGHQYMETLACV